MTKPTDDLAFKKILASEDHKTVTQGFIVDFFGLEVDVDELRITNPYSIDIVEETPHGEEQVEHLYQTFRDITVEVDHLDLTVELQVCKQSYFPQRAFYYAARLYTSHYHQRPGPERYTDLRPVWSMSILDEPIFGCQHGFHMFSLHDPDLSEALEPALVRLGFFELAKPPGVDAHRQWQYFLRTGKAATDAPSYIQEAASMIDDANLSQKERDMDALLEKFRADQYGQIAYARNEGLTQGRVEGARENQVANARAALALGLPVADVAAITGLDTNAVQQLTVAA